MRIVLRKTAYPCKAVQLAALLVAVNRSKLGKSNGQVTVAPRRGVVNFAVMWTIHGFEQEFFSFCRGVYGLKTIGAIFFIVPRSHIQFFLPNMWRYDLFIARFDLRFAQKLLESFAQCCPFGQPKRQALAYFLGEGKKTELSAQLAVVAFFCFFQQFKVFCQQFLLWKRHPVDTGKLFVLFVTTPVGTGDIGEFYGLDDAGIWNMSTAAEIGKIVVIAKGDAAII